MLIILTYMKSIFFFFKQHKAAVKHRKLINLGSRKAPSTKFRSKWLQKQTN